MLCQRSRKQSEMSSGDISMAKQAEEFLKEDGGEDESSG